MTSRSEEGLARHQSLGGVAESLVGEVTTNVTPASPLEQEDAGVPEQTPEQIPEQAPEQAPEQTPEEPAATAEADSTPKHEEL